MLAKMLPLFAKKGVFSLAKFRCKEDQLPATFKARMAVYHRQCYLDYDQQHYDRISVAEVKRKAEESDQSGPSTSKQNKRESIPLGKMICYICEKSDKTDNLHAAGVMHATTNTVDKQHIKDSTKKIKEMASYLDLRHAVAKLSSGDIVSNELYYHGHCYKQMCNDFAKKKNEESKQEGFKQKEREDYIKTVSFNKVLTHVHEGMSSNNESGVNFHFRISIQRTSRERQHFILTECYTIL